MSTHPNDRSMAGRLITWFFVALLAVAALKLAFWAVRVALGVGGFLLFTVGPILLLGWLVVKVVRFFSSDGAPESS